MVTISTHARTFGTYAATKIQMINDKSGVEREREAANSLTVFVIEKPLGRLTLITQFDKLDSIASPSSSSFTCLMISCYLLKSKQRISWKSYKLRWMISHAQSYNLCIVSMTAGFSHRPWNRQVSYEYVFHSRMLDWSFTARQHKIGQVVPVYQGGAPALVFESSLSQGQLNSFRFMQPCTSDIKRIIQSANRNRSN